MIGRPFKATVEYFSHDSHASEGRTLTILFNYFGHAGISCWWQLLERLSVTGNHFIDIGKSEDCEFVAAKMHFTVEELKPILDKLAELNAIDPKLYSHGIIWCQNLVDRLEKVYKKRKQDLPSKPELMLPETDLSATESDLSATESTQSKVKKSKVNNNGHFDAFWKAYPRKVAKKDAIKAFHKIDPDDELIEKMLLAIKKYIGTKSWREGYIPNPATWLNGERWEDDIQENGNGANKNSPVARGVKEHGEYTRPEDI